MKNIFKIIFIALFLPSLTLGAELLFENQTTNIQQNIPFDIDMEISPQNQNINAISSSITFDPQFLSVNFINDAGSVFTIWIAPPKIDEKNGQISFAGIVPGGFWQEKGKIISVEFLPKKQGQTQIGFLANTQVLLNDGKGTPAAVSQSPLQVLIGPGINISPIQSQIQDKFPPEAFTPIISRNKDIFNNQWFLVFQTEDKGSGIDHYEVKEGAGPWQVAQSPYLLKNQRLDDKIQVKAVDRAGNYTVETLPAQHSKLIRYLLYTLIVLLIVFLAYNLYIKLLKR